MIRSKLQESMNYSNRTRYDEQIRIKSKNYQYRGKLDIRTTYVRDHSRSWLDMDISIKKKAFETIYLTPFMIRVN